MIFTPLHFLRLAYYFMFHHIYTPFPYTDATHYAQNFSLTGPRNLSAVLTCILKEGTRHPFPVKLRHSSYPSIRFILWSALDRFHVVKLFGKRGGPFDIQGCMEAFWKKKKLHPLLRLKKTKTKQNFTNLRSKKKKKKKKINPTPKFDAKMVIFELKKNYPPVKLKKKKNSSIWGVTKKKLCRLWRQKIFFLPDPTSMPPWKSNGAPLIQMQYVPMRIAGVINFQNISLPDKNSKLYLQCPHILWVLYSCLLSSCSGKLWTVYEM